MQTLCQFTYAVLLSIGQTTGMELLRRLLLAHILNITLTVRFVSGLRSVNLDNTLQVYLLSKYVQHDVYICSVFLFDGSLREVAIDHNTKPAIRF